MSAGQDITSVYPKVHISLAFTWLMYKIILSGNKQNGYCINYIAHYGSYTHTSYLQNVI